MSSASHQHSRVLRIEVTPGPCPHSVAVRPSRENSHCSVTSDPQWLLLMYAARGAPPAMVVAMSARTAGRRTRGRTPWSVPRHVHDRAAVRLPVRPAAGLAHPGLEVDAVAGAAMVVAIAASQSTPPRAEDRRADSARGLSRPQQPSAVAESMRTRLFGCGSMCCHPHDPLAVVKSPQPRMRCGPSCGEIVPPTDAAPGGAHSQRSQRRPGA